LNNIISQINFLKRKQQNQKLWNLIYQKINLQSLINTAMTSVKMADVLPENDAHILVRKQSKAILAEAVQIKLHENLIAMSKREERVTVAESE
jgi:hypothetical protein